ncbi:cytochrome P450 [Nocardia sp. alder85J]|uniref:cytochrome P450 n=1 Tax=Nocardia sp. alder85J TaxID=2862949 RepID=UPI001CD2143F|nr:cytochrome P450 [Nocardia sp. alder85J]MCX4090899.1 cytochrome P450 [Nocardia sp. alder85J]
MSPTAIPLRELPRVRHRDTKHLGGLIRPGTHRSPLAALGDRFVVDPPGFPTMLVTRDLDDVWSLFAAREDFSLGKVLSRLSSHDELFGTRTLIFLDGEDHRRERRLFAPAFQPQAVLAYEDLIGEVVERVLPSWPIGQPFEFLRAGYDLAIGVLLGVVFGTMPPARLARLCTAVGHWFEAIESRGFLAVTLLTPFLGGYTLPYLPLRRTQAHVDAVVLEEIADRRATGRTGADVLSRYVGTDSDRHDDAGLARDMRGILLGAYETTAMTLGWIAALLAGHPEVMAEVDAAADAGDTERLDTYLDAVVAESMRVRPASPFTARRAVRDTVVNGVEIPRGTMVIVPILMIHESPQHYPDPLAFRPERFLAARPETRTWLAFGGGVHRCLGAQFALLEARVMFRAILRHRRIDVTPGYVEPPRRLHTGISPAHNARITMRRR